MSLLEYVEKYAICYCGGDIEEAKTHAIVREVAKSYKEEALIDTSIKGRNVVK